MEIFKKDINLNLPYIIKPNIKKQSITNKYNISAIDLFHDINSQKNKYIKNKQYSFSKTKQTKNISIKLSTSKLQDYKQNIKRNILYKLSIEQKKHKINDFNYNIEYNLNQLKTKNQDFKNATETLIFTIEELKKKISNVKEKYDSYINKIEYLDKDYENIQSQISSKKLSIQEIIKNIDNCISIKDFIINIFKYYNIKYNIEEILIDKNTMGFNYLKEKKISKYFIKNKSNIFITNDKIDTNIKKSKINNTLYVFKNLLNKFFNDNYQMYKSFIKFEYENVEKSINISNNKNEIIKNLDLLNYRYTNLIKQQIFLQKLIDLKNNKIKLYINKYDNSLFLNNEINLKNNLSFELRIENNIINYFNIVNIKIINIFNELNLKLNSQNEKSIILNLSKLDYFYTIILYILNIIKIKMPDFIDTLNNEKNLKDNKIKLNDEKYNFIENNKNKLNFYKKKLLKNRNINYISNFKYMNSKLISNNKLNYNLI